ncbi:hypothetical protein Mal52_27830 [Symmachiella dynata]|uniref:Uncharacterized protein n=1 Tax=Symmachiella dynata TaxID=2527995 RepID=A0A517ZP92_9PLAN|nr:hypothetical protein Mal52_27830 [Symmachiella dynata]
MPQFSRKTLQFGFFTGLVFAGAAFIIAACYLAYFLVGTSSSVDTLLEKYASSSSLSSPLDATNLRLAMLSRLFAARLALLSCGTFVGLAFGFLGFSLFLIGIGDEMDAEATSEHYSIKVARMSPGVFVLLCATMLIYGCVTFDGISLNYSIPSQAVSTGAEFGTYDADSQIEDDTLSSGEPPPIAPIGSLK